MNNSIVKMSKEEIINLTTEEISKVKLTEDDKFLIMRKFVTEEMIEDMEPFGNSIRDCPIHGFLDYKKLCMEARRVEAEQNTDCNTDYNPEDNIFSLPTIALSIWLNDNKRELFDKIGSIGTHISNLSYEEQLKFVIKHYGEENIKYFNCLQN